MVSESLSLSLSLPKNFDETLRTLYMYVVSASLEFSRVSLLWLSWISAFRRIVSSSALYAMHIGQFL